MCEIYNIDTTDADIIVGYRADDSYTDVVDSFLKNEISIDEIRKQIEFLKNQKLFKKWLKNKDADIYENPDLFMLRPWL